MSEEEKVGSVIDPKRELTAMQKIAEALQGLDEVAIARILPWGTELHGVQAGTAAVRPPVSTLETRIAELPQQHGELADFYAACDPETDAEKAVHQLINSSCTCPRTRCGATSLMKLSKSLSAFSRIRSLFIIT